MIQSRIAGMMLGGILYLFSIITKEQVGKGDAILLAVTGLGLGFWNNVTFFFFGLLCAAIYSIVRIVRYGFKRKECIPFVPFLLAGYIIFSILKFRFNLS